MSTRRRRHPRMTRPVATALVALVAGLLAPSAALGVSDPRIGLRPGGSQPQFVDASVEVAREGVGDGVDMTLPWDKLQPDRRGFEWEAQDAEFRSFIDRQVPVVTLRVTGAPDWAIEGRSCRYSMCPPARDHYDDFKRFAFRALKRYGPGTPYDVQRFAFWNEPDHPFKWGGEGVEDRSYADYSALLSRFHQASVEAAAASGLPQASVDAGEVMAGSDTPRPWVRQFTRYNTDQGRNRNYDALTIHGYSRSAQQVADKLNDYQSLPGVTRVSVSEFGWSVGQPNKQVPGGSFKCVDDEADQEDIFRDTVEAVRADTTGVGRLVWLNAIDRSRDKKVRCLDRSYYDDDVEEAMNPYGLYKAKPNGDTFPFEELEPRPIKDTFAELAGP